MAGVGVGDIVAQSGVKLPAFDMGAIGGWASIIAGIFLVGIIITGIVIWLIMNKRWNKKILIFKDVNGKTECVATDRGMFEKISLAGDFWLRLQKNKSVLSRPTYEISKNTYWYFQRDDGELINFNLGSLNYEMRKANAFYVHEDMRLQRLGIHNILKTRLQKPSFLDKYGVMIGWGIFFIILTICLVIITGRVEKLIGKLDSIAGSITTISQSFVDTCRAQATQL